MHCCGNGSDVGEKGIHELHLLVHHHVDHSDDPRRVQQRQLTRSPPEGIWNRQVAIVLRSHNIQKRVVEHRVNSMIRKLLPQPRRPVILVPPVATAVDFFRLALVEFDGVVAVADGHSVLDLHEVGEDLRVGGVVAPGLAEVVVVEDVVGVV